MRIVGNVIKSIKLWFKQKFRKSQYLNVLTLQIKDPQIEKLFTVERADHFNRTVRPLFLFSTVYFLRHVILKATDPEENYNQLIDATILLLISLLFALLARVYPVSAPKVVYLLALYVCIYPNLVYRD